jgi:glc operon protein GlcG
MRMSALSLKTLCERRVADVSGELLRAVLGFSAMFNLQWFEPSLLKLTIAVVGIAVTASAADLPTKKYLDLKSIKALVAAAEAEAQRQHVSVTLCIVDESGNLLFLEKGDTASLNTITWAQRKARHAAFYNAPSKNAEDTVKQGHVEALAYPEFFPNQGGLPIVVDGQLVGGMSASGAKSEIDEAVVRAALDAFTKK